MKSMLLRDLDTDKTVLVNVETICSVTASVAEGGHVSDPPAGLVYLTVQFTNETYPRNFYAVDDGGRPDRTEHTAADVDAVTEKALRTFERAILREAATA